MEKIWRGMDLVHYKSRVKKQRRLVVVGHDAPDEVGVGRVQSGQEGVQLRSEGRRDGLEDLRPCVLTLLFLFNNLNGVNVNLRL